MKEEAFNELLESINQAKKIEKDQLVPIRTFEFNSFDVKAIREKTKKSQSDFARMIGINVGTLRNWEQKIRKPDGAAVSLLKLVDANPDFVESVLVKN